MSNVGRPPLPDAWKKMTGNPGHRALDGDAVNYEAGAPPCPAIVERNRAAKAEWDRIVPLMITAGVLCTVDMAALTMYCIALARYYHAEEQIALEEQLGAGGVVSSSKNGFEQLGQWYIVSHREQDRIDKFESKYGFNASARVRVKAMAGQGDLFGNDPLTAFQRAAPRSAA